MFCGFCEFFLPVYLGSPYAFDKSVPFLISRNLSKTGHFGPTPAE
jgi:hypothetical protein